MQCNAFFAHRENVILGMLSDNSEDIRSIAVNKIQMIRTTFRSKTLVRQFIIPELKLNAEFYHKLINLNEHDVKEPPAKKQHNDLEIEKIKEKPLFFKHPCHNQAVKIHIKVITKASMSVVRFQRHGGIARQKLRSRKLMQYTRYLIYGIVDKALNISTC